MTNNIHIGSSFDDFLAEENILEETSLNAFKETVIWQLEQAIEKQHFKKIALATALNTNIDFVEKTLNPNDPNCTLENLERLAAIVGVELETDLAKIN